MAALSVAVVEMKTPYRDGTSHLVMSPLEFMQRLAALVPRPRLTSDPFSWGAGASRQTAGGDRANSRADDYRARAPIAITRMARGRV